jgi:hypothetical protein
MQKGGNIITGLPPQLVQDIIKGNIKPRYFAMVFSIEVNDGGSVSVDDRTPSDGVFQVEYINIIASDVFKLQINDTFNNSNWFSEPIYSTAIGGDGKGFGYLPAPILLNPATQIIVSAIYDSTDPNTGGNTKVKGQVVIGGYVLTGLTDLLKYYRI